MNRTQVVIANPMQVRIIAHAKIKTDTIDAKVLAQLYASGFLPEVWIPDEPTQALRRQVTRRNQIVRQRSRLKNIIQSILHSHLTNARSAVLSIITGGGKWIEMAIPADSLYQHFLVTAEKRFWRCVQSGEIPRPYGIEPPRPRIEAVRMIDMSESNSWAQFAGLFCATRSVFLDHERAKSELKALMPEDAKEASGHGVRAKRSKSGSVSFDLLAHGEGSHAAVQ